MSLHSMTRRQLPNLIFAVVVAGTALGVYSVHEEQNEERRRLREGVVRDRARLAAREEAKKNE